MQRKLSVRIIASLILSVIWETEKTKVSNRELKGMVEFYKSRGKEQEEKPRESLKDRLSEKKAEVSQQKHDAPQKTATKSKEASL